MTYIPHTYLTPASTICSVTTELCGCALPQVSTYDVLRKALDDKLKEYNETNAVMDLVLFQQVGGPGQTNAMRMHMHI